MNVQGAGTQSAFENDILGLPRTSSSQEAHSAATPEAHSHDRNESSSSSIYYDMSDIGQATYSLIDQTASQSLLGLSSRHDGAKLKGKETRNMRLGESRGNSSSGSSVGVDVDEDGKLTNSQINRREPAIQTLPGSNCHPRYYRVPDIQYSRNPKLEPSGGNSASSAFTRMPSTQLPFLASHGNTDEDRANWERVQAIAGPSLASYNYDSRQVPALVSDIGPDTTRMAQKRKERSSEDAHILDGSTSREFVAYAGHRRPPPYTESSASSDGNSTLLSCVSPSQTRRREDAPSRSAIHIPRWQPDAAVTVCPICGTQFSFFLRKHHCSFNYIGRKCGRVVCNPCSPHRITIPYQFIVQPPTEIDTLNNFSSRPYPTLDPARASSSSEFESLGGGQRVRLCNPCVPDPNTAPPQTPQLAPQPQSILRNSHSRSASSSTYTTASQAAFSTSTPSERAAAPDKIDWRTRPRQPSVLGRHPSHSQHTTGHRGPSFSPHQVTTNYVSPHQAYPDLRARSSTVSGGPVRLDQNPQRTTVPGVPARVPRVLAPSGSHTNLHTFVSQPEHESRALPRVPRAPRIAEEDECPICHQELPSNQLPNSEALRAAHITNCIERAMQGTSTSSPPPQSSTSPHVSSQVLVSTASSSSLPVPPTPVPIANTPEARMAAREQAHAAVVLGQHSSPSPSFRRTGVFPYKATEKDCVDEAECTICLEEFETGQDMGRLECFCRFHLHCIREWFVNHYGQCPVHHQAY